ncbi:MAG: diguanylate cyclase [Zoogloeaceae bacterium]|nr:diguanylate cyclase [Zoogloeaceae bacterium]
MENILLVHRSKVVRVTLARYLKEHFGVLEAPDGDVAWQMLVLHHDIAAVIAGLDVSKTGEASWATSSRISGLDTALSGMDLLDRLRYNSLQRLKHLPFYFIGSETHIEEISKEAHEHKVTGFLFNGMSQEEVLAALNIQSAPPKPEPPPPVEEPASMTRLQRAGILSTILFKSGVERTFSRPGTRGALLMFGLNDYEGMIQRLGAKTAESIVDKFADLVQAKVETGDFVGHCGPGAFAISTRVSDLKQCGAFAKRVVRNLSAAKIAVHGQPMHISVSFSIACIPADGNLSGTALLNLALARLAEAKAAGGGQVQT